MFTRAVVFFLLTGSFFGSVPVKGQRVYAAHSVLANGSWYRIGIRQEGVYKIDVPFLASLGINTSNLSSATIRLYGNGGAMLDENNAVGRIDDLAENPVEMFDGGDGIFNGQDYFLFYAPGPHRWVKDSTNQSFRHIKNLYTDTVAYYITLGGTGRRLVQQTSTGTATVTVNSFNDHYFYENDLVNLLNSGKEWLGEEFNSNLGGSLTRNFQLNWPGLQTNQPLNIAASVAARSVGAPSSFTVSVNGQTAISPQLPAVSGGFLDPTASLLIQQNNIQVNQSALTIAFRFQPGTAAAQGWLNWFEVMGRRNLALDGANQLSFRDWSSVKSNAVAGFTIVNNGNNPAVWEVTDPLLPVKMNVTVNGTQTIFQNDVSRLREYIAFTSTLTPFVLSRPSNQDLHGNTPADLLIITHGSLLAEAQRLAQFHVQRDGYRTAVVTADQVYQEFSGGAPDPTALRDFVKMYYDRAANNTADRPKYLLLFGAASYDYRNRIPNNTNLVPGYESLNALDPLSTYTSDDFFGLLDDSDNINANNSNAGIDIAIGRIPAKNMDEAKIMVDKIIHYHTAASLGSWRNQSVFIADDKDQNLHLSDAELIAADASAANPVLGQYKIYLDAYPLVSTSAGARYPAVNDAIVSQVFNGTLLLNYSGHGSYQRLADESVLTQEELNRFNNPDKLSLFITASCDFAPYDDPAKNSLGAGVLTGNTNGAIALLTTTRLVFAYSNRQINDNYLKIALKPQSNGQFLTLGESVRQTKNFTAVSSGDLLNNRKFTLLGDPAMRLAFPELRLQITGVNGGALTGNDTLKPLQKYTLTGVVTDASGIPVNSFNGNLQPVVYDKQQPVKTLGNDPSSPVVDFNQQGGVLYKGSASVKDGKFSFSFVVPKDISYQAGKARISLYADNGVTDAAGVNTDFFAGGTPVQQSGDNQGPLILPYINDDQFRDGGITHENPVLLVKLADSSGISTSGNGIGHDITAVIDGDERNVLVLNAFYTAEKDSYQRGQVLYQLPTLTEGMHTVRIKAWDVANNSSEVTIRFEVVKKSRPVLGRVFNYPNPFSNTTTLFFEHNQPNTELSVTVRIFDNSGRQVKEIKQQMNTGTAGTGRINWAGDNEAGAKLQKGIYIYKVIVVAGGTRSESTRQLILF